MNIQIKRKGNTKGDQTHKTPSLQKVLPPHKPQEEMTLSYAERLRFAMEAAGMGIWEYDVCSGTLIWDEQMLTFYGYTRENFPGNISLWDERLHPEDKSRHQALLNEALAGTNKFDCEFRIIRLDGSICFLKTNGLILRDEDGNPIRMIGLSKDITERKQMEQALQQSEERFRRFMDNSPFLAWITDVDGKVHYVNNTLAHSFDTEPDTLVGKTSFDMYPYGIAAEHVANNHWVLATGQRLETVEDRLGPDGKERHFLVYKFPVEDNDYGTLIGGLAIDITEREKLEAHLRQSEKIDSIGRLAGGIAHDFNNLLAVIMGYAELVDESLLEGDRVHISMQNIQNAATRAAGLTKQLLAFARKQAITPEVISPNAILMDMMQMLNPLIGERIETTTQLDPNAGQIFMDANQLEQVIMNLVVNARDAMPEGGKLTLKTEDVWHSQRVYRENVEMPVGRYVVLKVGDTGTGMSAETQAHLFEPFFTTRPQGTGLGLATVYGIVKQNKGFVWVASQIGVGTTFTVYLPYSPEALREVPTVARSNRLIEGDETVLVVEDEPMLRELTVTTLRSRGYRVLEAENGVQALQVVANYSGPIHLLMTDAIMPEMGGLELARKLRAVNPTLPVLLASGYSAEVFTEDAALLAEMILLQKPFTTRDLLKTMREILDGVVTGK